MPLPSHEPGGPLADPASSSVDMFLDLTLKRAGKVKGESVAVGHTDDIAIRGFSWGVGAPTDVVTGLQSGRRSYRSLTLHKTLDASSTALMSAVASNDEVRSARLCLRKAGGEQVDYCTLTLEKARVVSVDLESDAQGHPLEKVSFNFQKVEIEYRVQGGAGQLGASFTFMDELSA